MEVLNLTDKQKVELLLDFIDYTNNSNMLVDFITNQFPVTTEQAEDWVETELDTRDTLLL